MNYPQQVSWQPTPREPMTATECRTGFDPSKLQDLPPTIQQRFIVLEKDLVYLGEKINEVKVRIDPILRSVGPEPVNTACDKSIVSNSEMFEALNRLDRSVHQHIDVLNEILNRVQL